jgi:hypothetical protein
MAMSRWSRTLGGGATALALTLGAWLLAAPVRIVAGTARQAAAGQSLPERLSDAEFWSLVSDISEPGGFFQISDNYTSNEMEIGRIFGALQDRGVRGGVYLGVGPEQNFSYIAAIHPAMAFIVDIRRQAVMQHLMYKALFELARDRGEFISLLFSMRRPEGIDDTTPIQAIWAAYDPIPTDKAGAPKISERVVEHLTKTHGFALTADEVEQVESVLAAFVRFGPDISTRGAPRGSQTGNGSTFSDLTSWSLDAYGKPQSFLVSEDHFRFVKSMQERNLIVPVSGDFGGPKAIRAIAKYLQKQNATVSAFYLSNVEQYLFQDSKQNAFYDNVATLPVDATSVFIRPYSLRRGGNTSLSLCPIGGFLTEVSEGRIRTNNDALACGR